MNADALQCNALSALKRKNGGERTQKKEEKEGKTRARWWMERGIVEKLTVRVGTCPVPTEGALHSSGPLSFPQSFSTRLSVSGAVSSPLTTGEGHSERLVHGTWVRNERWTRTGAWTWLWRVSNVCRVGHDSFFLLRFIFIRFFFHLSLMMRKTKQKKNNSRKPRGGGGGWELLHRSVKLVNRRTPEEKPSRTSRGSSQGSWRWLQLPYDWRLS